MQLSATRLSWQKLDITMYAFRLANYHNTYPHAHTQNPYTQNPYTQNPYT